MAETTYTLKTPLNQVRFIGQARYDLLKAKGLTTVLDLLNYFPYKYQDTSNILPIYRAYEQFLRFSMLPEFRTKLTLLGIAESVQLIKPKYRRNLKIIKAVFKDPYKGENKVSAIWFNQIHLLKTIAPGKKYVLYGDIYKKGSHLELVNPQIEAYKIPLTHLGRLTPIYSRIHSITPKMIRRFIKEIRPAISQIKEFVPLETLRSIKSITLPQAYDQIHFPKDKQAIKKAYERLFYQEILELLEKRDREKTKTPREKVLGERARDLVKELHNHVEAIAAQLPFTLTDDQKNAITQLLEGFKKDKTFLLYGEVGSGKTVVFFLLSVALAQLGYSSILIAPTSILANQHFETFQNFLKELQLNVQPKLLKITSGTRVKSPVKLQEPTIIIGTHAILYKEIQPTESKLALVGVDEEHKFGIFQREKLLDVSEQQDFSPYQVSLTATPIPRTLALTFYGYQQSIYILQRPKQRQLPKTYLLPPQKLNEFLEWVKDQILNHNQQVFFVFPRIEGEDITDYALEPWHEYLKDQLKNIPSGILHGRLKEKDKDKVITDFKEGKTKLLFATTIIEVGVDIPSANIMIIFGPELLGLAQLHQLRGRVGRADTPGSCFLFTFNKSQSVLKRLKYFIKTPSGLKLAEYDLQHRGPGDVLVGKQQHGWRKLKIANLNNYYLLNKAIQLYNALKEKGTQVKFYITES